MGKKENIIVSTLLNALQNQNLRSIKNLIDTQTLSLSEWLPDLGVTPLHLAVGSGTEGFAACVTHDMLRNGADPNAVSSDGMTCVHVAAAWGRSTVLHLLLLHGGDPWRQDEDKKNAFNYAFEVRDWAIVELLHSLQFIPSSVQPQCCHQSQAGVNYTVQDELNLSSESSSNKSDQSSQTSRGDIKNIHNVTFCIETNAVPSGKFENDEPIVNNTYISTHNHTVKTKNISMNPNENIDAYVKGPLSPHQIPKKTPPKDPCKAVDRRLTFTVVKPKIFKENECINSRYELFDELKEAVRRRSLRLSGVETLPSDSFLTYNDTQDVNESHATNRNSSISLDLNKAIISDSQLSDVKPELDAKSIHVELKMHRFVEEKVDVALPHPLTTESAVSNSPDVIDTLDSSTHYLSLSDESDSSLAGFESCESPPDERRECNENEAEDIRSQLVSYGVNPGPITPSTRAVYARLLGRLQQRGTAAPPNTPSTPVQSTRSPTVCISPTLYFPSSYSIELENALNGNYCPEQYESYEDGLRREFDGLSRARTCFNYLLLDQRVTQDLPHRVRASAIEPLEVTRQFIAAIFYVGKGHASRPLEHLKEAKLAWQYSVEGKNPKEAKILDIWRSGKGVICLRVFQDISNDEAHTREAAMIEAMRRQNLCNLQPGHFYGAIAHWSNENKKKLGVHLLLTAKDIFLQTSERSFRPTDL